MGQAADSIIHVCPSCKLLRISTIQECNISFIYSDSIIIV
jgi:hypothetical protein